MISCFVPSGAVWVNSRNDVGHGNLTQHKSINKLTAGTVQFEVRDEDSEAQDVRDQTMAEFWKEMKMFRKHEEPTCPCRNPLMGV